MKAKTLILIAGSFIFSSGFVVILFLTSFDFTKQNNDFLRQFPPHVIMASDTINLRYNSYYVAGGTQHEIYFGNYKGPLHVLSLKIATGDTTHSKLKIKNSDTLTYWSLRLKVDSPYFHLADGTIPAIFSGNVTNWEANRHVYDSAYFVEYTPLSSSSFAIRSLSIATQEHELGKEQTFRPPHVKFNPDLLQKQIDGIFCVDGSLQYDKHHGYVVYTYYYRNEFIVMDTNMNLTYRGKTIDTVSRAQIKLETITSSNTRTMSAPPVMVNGQSSASNGYLFINSKLLARNEDIDAHRQASVIDVYSLIDGHYVFSFYIHALNKDKMGIFKVLGDKLIAHFGSNIVIYQLTPDYFTAKSPTIFP